MLKNKIINSEFVNLYKNSTFKSEIVSQALFWEKVEIIESIDNWYKIKQHDNYISYIYKDYLIDLTGHHDDLFSDKKKWFFIKDRLVEVVSIKGNCKKILSFGTLIPIIENNENDCSVLLLPDNQKYLINSNSIFSFDLKLSFKDIVDYAMNVLDVPYFWGGRSGFGFDCSGLIQHLYRFYNIILPRDCSKQIKFNKFIKVNSDYIAGDLIYFYKSNIVDHVGMFINNNEFIHSSGYVKINSINENSIKYNNTFDSHDYNVFRMNSNA